MLTRTNVNAHSTNEYRFGEFRLARARRRLLREGRPVVLTRASWAILIYLIERQGKFVAWKKLAPLLSSRVAKTEELVAREMSLLQESLLLAGDGNLYFSFDPARGYCFVAPVEIKKRRRAKRPLRLPRTREELVADLRLLLTVLGPGIYAALLILGLAIAGPILLRWRFPHLLPSHCRIAARRWSSSRWRRKAAVRPRTQSAVG